MIWPNFLAKIKLLAESSSKAGFFTPRVKLVFVKFRQLFIKTPILYHFDLKCHIWFETDVSNYDIDKVLSQLTLDHSAWWHVIVFIFKKIIMTKTWYETYKGKLLIIIGAFKTRHYYLKDCKYKIFILTDLNKLCHFMDTKNLSFGQISWAQKLFWYYFRINYR